VDSLEKFLASPAFGFGFGAFVLFVAVASFFEAKFDGSVYLVGFGLFIFAGSFNTDERWQEPRIGTVDQGGKPRRALVLAGSAHNQWADALMWTGVLVGGIGLAFISSEPISFSLWFDRAFGVVLLAAGSFGLISRLGSFRHGVGLSLSSYGVTCNRRRMVETIAWDGVRQTHSTTFSPRYGGIRLGSFDWFGFDVRDPRSIERSALYRIHAALELRSTWRGVDIYAPLPTDKSKSRRVRRVLERLVDEPESRDLLDTYTDPERLFAALARPKAGGDGP
jgi:hypothetical protein